MDENDLNRIRKETIKRLIFNEALEPFDWNSTFDALKGQRYPFERTLEDYYAILPGLKSKVDALTPEHRVLDIGCGQGLALNTIINQKQCFSVGTGLKFLNEIPVPFISAIGAKLPFLDNTFDLVISVHSISWEPDQLKAVREVERILKKGATGLLYFCSFSTSVLLWFDEDFWLESKVTKEDFVNNEFNENDIYEMPAIKEFIRKGMKWKSWLYEYSILINK